jgi:hypothetical protein
MAVTVTLILVVTGHLDILTYPDPQADRLGLRRPHRHLGHVRVLPGVVRRAGSPTARGIPVWRIVGPIVGSVVRSSVVDRFLAGVRLLSGSSRLIRVCWRGVVVRRQWVVAGRSELRFEGLQRCLLVVEVGTQHAELFGHSGSHGRQETVEACVFGVEGRLELPVLLLVALAEVLFVGRQSLLEHLALLRGLGIDPVGLLSGGLQSGLRIPFGLLPHLRNGGLGLLPHLRGGGLGLRDHAVSGGLGGDQRAVQRRFRFGRGGRPGLGLLEPAPETRELLVAAFDLVGQAVEQIVHLFRGVSPQGELEIGVDDLLGRQRHGGSSSSNLDGTPATSITPRTAPYKRTRRGLGPADQSWHRKV